jgi:hypothetical protein
MEKFNPTTQGFVDGVGVGETGKPVTLISTKSQGIEGVGVTKGTKSQSKNAWKSRVLQLMGVGVGVGHTPGLNKFAEISGHAE